MTSTRKRVSLIAASLASWAIEMISPAKAGALDRPIFPAQQAIVPFDAMHKGAVATVNYHARRDGTFNFYLNLKFDPEHPSTRAKVQRVAGTGAARNGVPVDPGVPIPVRLVVTRLDRAGDAVVLDKQFQQEILESFGESHFSKIISSVALTTGDYRVEIEALSDIPELAGIPIALDIHVPGNLK